MSPEAQRIQALLFVAGEAVAKTELVELIKEPIAAVDNYLTELREVLSNQGLTLVTTSTHVQLTTTPEVADYLAQFQKEDIGELTKAGAETLAIIAYRGPISRYDIDLLRGVDSRSILRQLIRRGTVRRLQRSGRTPLYDITEDFLLNLGIARREDLPDFATLASSAAVEGVLNREDTQHGAS